MLVSVWGLREISLKGSKVLAQGESLGIKG